MTNEEIKTLTDLALNQAVEQYGIRVAMTRPYNHENGTTYATDGRILICIPSSMCKQYEEFPNARFPNVVPVMENHNSRSEKQQHTLLMKDMTVHKSDVLIGSKFFSKDVYKKVRDITAILGLKGWHVRMSQHSIILDNGPIHMLVMCLLESKNHALIPFSDDVLEPGIDVESGKAYIKELETRKAKEKEEDDMRNCIYTFTVVRSATMYVKADNIDEAKRIANKHCNDIDSYDFDYPEVDSYEDWSEEPSSDMETIYTADGECSYEEVCEQIEKEIKSRNK